MVDLLSGPWFDASRPLSAATPVWPGDIAFERTVHDVPGMVVSSFTTTCHVGTHLDAPLHLGPGKAAVHEIPVSRLMGDADLLYVPTRDPIHPSDLPADWEPRAPRVLFRTDSFPLGATPAPGFASIHPDLARWLADRGVELVGLDTPSVDDFADQAMTVHRVLDGLGLLWIEGLWLDALPAGLYRMIALPLKLVDAEAAPLRVLLSATSHKEPS